MTEKKAELSEAMKEKLTQGNSLKIQLMEPAYTSCF